MKKIANYPHKTYSHAVVAVDVVIFSIVEGKLQVLLLQLKELPFENSWAIPGGLVAPRETLEEAARRHLREKVGVKELHLEQLYTFGDPERDPKGWVVSVAYMALLPKNQVNFSTTSRYKDISWHLVSSLPSMAYDHRQIIHTAYARLKGKLEYTTIAYSLLPREFTLTELQNLYEIILGEVLDKRNFRKKILSLGIIKELPKRREGEAHRPAQLYSFTHRDSKIVDIL